MVGASTAERVERARAALAAAEQRTGARAVRTARTTAWSLPEPREARAPHHDPADDRAPGRAVHDGGPVHAVRDGGPAVAVRDGRATSGRVGAGRGVGTDPVTGRPVVGAGDVDDRPAPAEGTRRTSLLTTERPPLPVPPGLAAVLPDGLRRGATTAVLGSTSLALGVLAHACAGGAWAVAVGQPDLGLLAASQSGVDLARFAAVPTPGPDTATVLGALLDGVDVVLVGPGAVLADADRHRLSARARERGSVLLPTVAWPGAAVVLTVEHARWTGVGAGDGRLRTRELRVRRTGRGSAAVPHAVDVVLPFPPPGDGAPAGPGRTRTTEATRGGLRLVG